MSEYNFFETASGILYVILYKLTYKEDASFKECLKFKVV